MKILLIDGSFQTNGCITYGLSEIGQQLQLHGIETEIYSLYDSMFETHPFYECMNKKVNEVIEKIKDCGGLVIGSSCIHEGMCGELKLFLDSFFDKCPQSLLMYKPACAIVNGRRSGLSNVQMDINLYFLTHHMTLVGTSYWPLLHGNSIDECKRDEETVHALKCLGLNMTYYLCLREHAKKEGLVEPKHDEIIFTDFIRQDSYVR